MRIWLDDIRPMPPDFDLWFVNAKGLIDYIKEGKPIDFISFDHDLADEHYNYSLSHEELTGYDVAKYIEILAHSGKIKRFDWAVHSANPVGRNNITMAMLNAEKYWELHRKVSNQ